MSWAAYRERIHRGVQRWSLRDKPTETSTRSCRPATHLETRRRLISPHSDPRLRQRHRDESQGVMHKIRWVDDRFAVMVTGKARTAGLACLAELLIYSGLSPVNNSLCCQLLLNLWDLGMPIVSVKNVALQVASFLVLHGGIAQTQEDVCDVVGVETTWVDSTGTLRAMDSEVVCLDAPQQWRMMTRMQLKDGGLLNVGTIQDADSIRFQAPRFPPAALDIRSRAARMGHLLGTISRLVDCTLIPEWALCHDGDGPGALDMMPGPVRSVWNWVMQPWQGTVLELWRTGATRAIVLEAVCRFQHCARDDEPVVKRTRILWTQLAAHELNLFYDSGRFSSW